ncbi:hypothetical protein J0683_24805, partial [Vibrio parahaemolyticus]|uniref:hypothetical protein n=1 Tax=Vibrio parahaemolyticus TaxID=670 RepID=UPI001A8F5E23|nr:hypothetical protein [Vibrio parahaemolyticus]
GYAQNVSGLVELTTVQYPRLSDIEASNQDVVSYTAQSLMMDLATTEGSKFRPFYPASRLQFAQSMVSAGLVSQYVAANALFTDVRD